MATKKKVYMWVIKYWFCKITEMSYGVKNYNFSNRYKQGVIVVNVV